ncbi:MULTISPECIES: hypothetical protein [unclassified Chamaesiphon]|uniref:hypothetical protein n=1 Tax=unclassified Chamaesiphon TaxID=2620921 RepID=UPI00286D27A9|nr:MULTISPECIES: hypothetical protein [unclassified Chamaesiphon]
MDSSKIINVDAPGEKPPSATAADVSQRQPLGDLPDIDSIDLRTETLATIDRLQQHLIAEFQSDISEIQERLNKSFRQFLLAKEHERMPFLQRVMTSHIENMEDERGFPPRHPVHWFKSKLEFSSTGVLEFDFKKDAEVFIESALNYIETEIKEQLLQRQQATIALVDRQIVELQSTLAVRLQPVAKLRRIIITEYVNSFIQAEKLIIKVIDSFYFVSMGARFNPKQELIYSEVCVRPTGIFDRSKDDDKPTQLKYAISCDRLVDIMNESIGRSVDRIGQQTQAYLTDELVPKIDKLFEDLAS